MYFCIVARCISSATLIQICCTRARFCPRCSYVQNTVGANITKFAWDLYLARSTYKSGEARCQDAKLYRQNRILTTCGWAQKQIATLSLLCWRHIGNIFMGKTNQNRHLYATLKISKLGAMWHIHIKCNACSKLGSDSEWESFTSLLVARWHATQSGQPLCWTIEKFWDCRELRGAGTGWELGILERAAWSKVY